MTSTYRLLADLIAGLHVGYVAAVVVGLLLTLLGGALGWRWVRNRWFRAVHLAMIVGVVIRAAMWEECPLTWWERDLRVLAGQVDFEGSPVGRVLHDVIHPDYPIEVFLPVYAAFAVLIGATLWLVPVDWKRRRTSPR